MPTAAVQGLIAAILTTAVVLLVPEQARIPILAGLLWLTVGIYLGMALMGGLRHSRTEWLGGLPILALAVGAVWLPWLLIVAWLIHPVWDVLHRGPIRTPIHPVVVPFCIVYDVAIAGLSAWVVFA